IHRVRVQATGTSPSGWLFRREQTLTAAVWHGGDRDANRDPRADGADSPLCDLLACLRETRAISPEIVRRLSALGIDLEALLRCPDYKCRSRHRPTADGAR